MTVSNFPRVETADFEGVPRQFDDGEGRSIDLRRYDGDLNALTSMYDAFDPSDRAQGLPPGKPDAIEAWLSEVIPVGVHVLAWHDGTVVGHAMLVGNGDDTYELAIFVLSRYQSAGIGTVLIRALLGEAMKEGIERIWLTVEPWNTPAIRLYESVGFKRVDTGGFERKMALALPTESS